MKPLVVLAALALVITIGCDPPTERAPEPEAPSPPSPQTNDCPAHVQCHPSWSACRCTSNARGDVTQMEADFDGDGHPDLRLTNVYDADGNLLRWENDVGADGTIETPCVFVPPCPPPHPSSTCSCYGAPQRITAEDAQDQLREAGDRALPVDPAEAQRILDAVEPSHR